MAAVSDTMAERWCSVAQAASELGLPERAIYRRIAAQAIRARRDPNGALLVRLDEGTGAEPALPLGPETRQRDDALTPERASTLSDFASALMAPLVERLAQQEATICAQAEELGRLRAQTALAGDLEDRLAPGFARQMAELAAIREEIERLNTRRSWWPFG